MSARLLVLMALAMALAGVAAFLTPAGLSAQSQVCTRKGAGALMARLPPEFRNSKVSLA